MWKRTWSLAAANPLAGDWEGILPPLGKSSPLRGRGASAQPGSSGQKFVGGRVPHLGTLLALLPQIAGCSLSPPDRDQMRRCLVQAPGYAIQYQHSLLSARRRGRRYLALVTCLTFKPAPRWINHRRPQDHRPGPHLTTFVNAVM